MVNLMSIRPIDMQTMLPKLQSMKFAKEVEINKHNNDMIDLNKETKEMSKEKANKILDAKRKEADKLRNDTSEHRQSKSRKEKKQKNNNEKRKKKRKIIKNKGNRFDMKV